MTICVSPNLAFLGLVLVQSLASCSSFRCFLEDVQSQALSTMEEDEDLPLLVSLADILEGNGEVYLSSVLTYVGLLCC